MYIHEAQYGAQNVERCTDIPALILFINVVQYETNSGCFSGNLVLFDWSIVQGNFKITAVGCDSITVVNSVLLVTQKLIRERSGNCCEQVTGLHWTCTNLKHRVVDGYRVCSIINYILIDYYCRYFPYQIWHLLPLLFLSLYEESFLFQKPFGCVLFVVDMQFKLVYEATCSNKKKQNGWSKTHALVTLYFLGQSSV
jgi:hypothetical protein